MSVPTSDGEGETRYSKNELMIAASARLLATPKCPVVCVR